MFDSASFDTINDLFRDRRAKAENDAGLRRKKAYSAIPGLEENDRKLASLGARIFGEALKGGADLQERIARIKEENIALEKKHGDLLEQNGFPRDFTDTRFECEKCHDTGYIGTNLCECMKKAIVSLSAQKSGLGKLVARQTFSTFDLSYYSERVLPDKTSSPREEMEAIFNYCKKYADDFSDSSPSLLFIGGTGLGKTHLSSAIAGEVIKKGYDVLYDSVPNVVSVFEKERFAESAEKTARYYDAELLILDDLGTEAGGKSAQSVIYNLINTRAAVKMLPTIISTNLSYHDLERQYDTPVISRLFGDFEVFLFAGDDIRMKKLEK